MKKNILPKFFNGDGVFPPLRVSTAGANRCMHRHDNMAIANLHYSLLILHSDFNSFVKNALELIPKHDLCLMIGYKSIPDAVMSILTDLLTKGVAENEQKYEK